MPPAPIKVQPKPGIYRDGTRFDAEGCVDGQWVRWQRGMPRKILGYTRLVNTLPQVVRAMHSYNQTGYNYVHLGSQSQLNLVRVSNAGAVPPVDKTPTFAFTISTNNLWQFDSIYDPVGANGSSLIAHAGQNLTDIDSAVETPLYWGSITSTSTAPFPMSLPINVTSYTVATVTGSTTSGVATVTSVSSTTNLRKGQTITGTGIAANTYIVSVDNASQITLNKNATATNVGVTLTASVGGVSGGVLVLHPYVLAFSSGGRVNWSTATDPNDFWGTGSGQAYITEQKIVRGMLMRGGPGTSPSGLLWSLNALIRVSFTGGSTTWSFDTVSDDITVLSSNSIVEADGIYFWAGTDRFFMYNGVVRELPNSQNLNWFYDNLNYTYRQKAFAFKSTRWGEIWFCYPRGTATECTHAVIYNYRENSWYDTQLPGSGRSAAVSPVVYPYPLMCGVDVDTSSGLYRLWQHNYGTDEVDGSNIAPIYSFFETNDFSLVALDQNAQNKRLEFVMLEPDFVQSGPMTVEIHANANARAAEVVTDSHTFQATATTPQAQVIPLKTTARQGRLRFTSNTIGGNYQMGQCILHAQPSDGTVFGATP